MNKCLFCGNHLPPTNEKGRPKKYCNKDCETQYKHNMPYNKAGDIARHIVLDELTREDIETLDNYDLHWKILSRIKDKQIIALVKAYGYIWNVQKQKFIKSKGGDA